MNRCIFRDELAGIPHSLGYLKDGAGHVDVVDHLHNKCQAIRC